MVKTACYVSVCEADALPFVPRAFHLGLSSLTGAGCCEMRAGPVVFGTAVLWSNSQPGAVDQEDLVMMRNTPKSQQTE